MSTYLGRASLATLVGKEKEAANVELNKALYFDKNASFAKMGLDRRVFKAVAKMGYIYPSLVQTKSIPFILEGRDVLVRARTGTGKTAAYVLPLIQRVLQFIDADATANVSGKSTDDIQETPNGSSIKAVILVPTRDLVDQVNSTFRSFSAYCREIVKATTLNGDSKKSLQIEAAQLKLGSQVIISTPSRLLAHLEAKSLDIKSMKVLVVDEADLVLSYGYEDDVRALNEYFPSYFQCVLMSATLTPELDALRGILLHNPAVVQFDEADNTGRLQQYFTMAPQHEKYLMIYVHIALGIYKGKTIFFVNSTAEAFRLKLFLEQFRIESAVLNDDLPYNSRRNIVLQFNRGVFDYLIATDLSNSEFDVAEQKAVEQAVKLEVFAESTAGDTPKIKGGIRLAELVDSAEYSVVNEQKEGETEEQYLDRLEQEESQKRKKSDLGSENAKSLAKQTSKKANDVGASRGIDFVDVQTVVNVDFPLTYKAYVHRIGRTARAGKAGQAVSYVDKHQEQDLLEQVMEAQCIQENDGIIATKEPELKPLPFDPESASPFRYRVAESKRKVTTTAIREARLKAVRSEMINSDKLKAHFEDNPHELQLLKHNKVLSNKTQLSRNLDFVPIYLIPQEYRNIGITGGTIEIGPSSGGLSSAKGRKKLKKLRSGGESQKRKRDDPLQSFTYDDKNGDKSGKRQKKDEGGLSKSKVPMFVKNKNNKRRK